MGGAGRGFGRRLLMLVSLIVFGVTLHMGEGTCLARENWQARDDLFSVSFSGKNQGWACGRWGTILHTSNQGRTWSHQESGVDATLTDIFFFNAHLGWAVGAGGTILHTTNGGKRWETQSSPVPFYHMGVHFVSPEKGWIASEETHILYTEDGGRTWDVQFKDEIFRLKAISFADEFTGWVVGEYGFTYGTRDGGKSWVRQWGKYEFCEEIGDFICGTFLFDVKAIDSMTAVAVGADSTIIMTRDGGATWKKREAPLAKPTHLLGVTADKSGHIAVSGKGVYLVSKDRGETFKSNLNLFEPGIEYAWLYALDTTGGQGLAAVGMDGMIYMGGIFSPITRQNGVQQKGTQKNKTR